MTNFNTKSPAVKRLMKEAQELSEPTELFYAQPIEENLFEWHFTIRGPDGSDFAGGVYHGRISLPTEYPMKPPNIIMLTANGRFEQYKKICLSISGYHPETWRPSWSIRTALLALIGFMPTSGAGAIGALNMPAEERRKLAANSQKFVCDVCGPIKDLVRPVTEASFDVSKEAAVVASQFATIEPDLDAVDLNPTMDNANDATESMHLIESVGTAVTSSLPMPVVNTSDLISLPERVGNLSTCGQLPVSPFGATQPHYWLCYPVYGLPPTLDQSMVPSTTAVTSTASGVNAVNVHTTPSLGPLSFEEWCKQMQSAGSSGLSSPSEEQPNLAPMPSFGISVNKESASPAHTSEVPEVPSIEQCSNPDNSPLSSVLFKQSESATCDAQSVNSLRDNLRNSINDSVVAKSVPVDSPDPLVKTTNKLEQPASDQVGKSPLSTDDCAVSVAAACAVFDAEVSEPPISAILMAPDSPVTVEPRPPSKTPPDERAGNIPCSPSRQKATETVADQPKIIRIDTNMETRHRIGQAAAAAVGGTITGSIPGTSTAAKPVLPSLSREIAQKMLREAAARHQRVVNSVSNVHPFSISQNQQPASCSVRTAHLAALIVSFLLFSLICRRLIFLIF